MKKLHVTMVALITCFALTGCGQLVSEKKQTTNANADAPQKATLTLMTSTKVIPNEPIHKEDKVLDPIYDGQFGKDYYAEINAPKKTHGATSSSSRPAKDSNGSTALDQKLQELRDAAAKRNQSSSASKGQTANSNRGSSDEAFAEKLQEMKDNAKRIQEKNSQKYSSIGDNSKTDSSNSAFEQKLQEMKDNAKRIQEKNSQKYKDSTDSNTGSNTDSNPGSTTNPGSVEKPSKPSNDAFDKKLQEMKDNAKRIQEKNSNRSSSNAEQQAKNNQSFEELLKKLKEKQQDIKDKVNK